jgi:F-type H+-transporting ATPase subunit beta
MNPSIDVKGEVVAVRGAVLDIAFANSRLPQIDEALIVEWDRPEALVIEVQAHLDERTYAASLCGDCRTPAWRNCAH